MAVEEKNKPETEETQEVPELKPKKKLPAINPRIFTVWVPLYIIQLVAVYFITAQILLNKVEGHIETVKNQVDTMGNTPQKPVKPSELGKFIYSIDDVIINPSDTEGKRLLLTSVGFDLKSEEDKGIIKDREILIKDAIISTLSSKTLGQLSSSAYKDSIKTEIADRVRRMVPELNLNTVYLSKYIIQ